MMSQRRKVEGFGFVPSESQHHFLVWLSKNEQDPVYVTEHSVWNEDPPQGQLTLAPAPYDPKIRVMLTRRQWNAIAEVVRAEFNQRLKRLGQKPCQWKVGRTPIERLLGKEIVLLAWSIEDAASSLIPVAIHNWKGLLPEERWWLFTMTNATTGQALKGRNKGWRKAIRYAFTENPVAGYSLREIEALSSPPVAQETMR